jgi:hypothetical protein
MDLFNEIEMVCECSGRLLARVIVSRENLHFHCCAAFYIEIYAEMSITSALFLLLLPCKKNFRKF